MSDDPRLGHEGGAPSAGRERDDLELPTQSVWSLVPKRSLMRALTMLVVLVALVLLQRRSGPIVERLTNIFLRPTPVERQKEAPSVRMAPYTSPARENK